MSASTPKPPPIKLKLSLGGPSAAPAAPAAPVAAAPSTLKKGKGKGALTNGFKTTSSKLSAKPKGKSTAANGGSRPPRQASVVSHADDVDPAQEEDNQPVAGPSRQSASPAPSVERNGARSATHDSEDGDYDPAAESGFVPAEPVVPTPAAATPAKIKATPARKPRGTPRGTTTKPKRGTIRKSRPSAIPPHLRSDISTPSRSSTSLPVTPGSSDVSVKQETSEVTSPDPLSLPLSPSASHADLAFTQDEEAVDTPSGRGRTGGKWMRLKKPLKELASKIIAEIRRKDDYALFEDPVDLEAFPDYLDVIGGEDKMMDMSTMQSKLDNGDYRNMDDFESDFRMLIEAAQKFNAPGTIPYTSAARIFTHGMKHIDRARPLVRTPTPSPTRDSATPYRGQSILSGREMTAALDDTQQEVFIDPASYIPEEMLSFPPNSLQALAVGWNLTGGKRVHAKRVYRSREKFTGKWRHWDLDGSRDLAEMEDIDSLLEQWRRTNGEDQRRIIDWKGMRKVDQWWEADMTAGPASNGVPQPPPPFAPLHPLRNRVSHRELDVLDWGVYPEIEAEVAFLKQRLGIVDDQEILSEHLRPAHPRAARNATQPPSGFTNVYETHLRRTAGDWVRDVCTGDVRGEAYLRSVGTFIKGAIDGRQTDQNLEPPMEFKPSTQAEKQEESTIDLNEYIAKNLHGGLLSGARAKVTQITQQLSSANDRPDYLEKMAQQAYARIALRQLMSPSNPMDIQPLLRQEQDFMYQGVGGKSGVAEGLQWVGEEIGRLVKIQEEERAMAMREVVPREGEDGENLQAEPGTGKRKRDDSDKEEDDVVAEKRVKLEAEVEQEHNNPPLEHNASASASASAGSSPLSAPPASPPGSAGSTSAKPVSSEMVNSPALPLPLPTKAKVEERETAENEKEEEKASEDALRKLRLELVALSKFYPLPALRKMSKEDAARLLPLNVRALMSRQ